MVHIGNEKADPDQLAKKGAMLNTEGPEPFVPISKSIFKHHTKLKYDQKWKKRWKDSSQFRQTKLWFPEPSSKIHYNLGQITRPEASKMIQVLTGHCNLRKHMAKVDKEKYPNTTCRLCQMEDETPWHIVTECPSLMNKRAQMFG